MGNYKHPIDKHDPKAERIRELRTAYQAGTGIGGGLVGAAIGGLLGRKLGGISGTVVGAVAGALIGKGTAQRVNRTVDSLVDAARSVAEGVNHSVVGVGDALKDTIDEVKPSVVGVVDAVKNTVEEVKPSVVSAAKSVAEGVNYSVNSVSYVGEALKDTIDQVKPSVISVVDAAKGTVEEVKPSVVGVVDVFKDTFEQVKPSVVGAAKSLAEAVNNSVNDVSDALKNTEEQNKPSVIGEEDATKATPEGINQSINDVLNALKETIDQIKQSIIAVEETATDTDEEVKLSGNHNNKIHEQLVTDHLSRSSKEHPLSNDVIPPTPLLATQRREDFFTEESGVFQENSQSSDEADIATDISEQVAQKLNDLQPPHSFQEIDSKELKSFQEIDSKEIEYKDIQHKEKEFQHQQETTQQLSQASIQPQTEKIQKATGIIIGSVILTLMGVTLGLSPKQNPLVIKSSAFSQIPSTPETTPEIMTRNNGWIFLGNINTSDSELVGKPLIKNSQSTDSPIVPSVGSIVTVNLEPGVTLRDNKPQAPNFSPQEQKALAVLKPQEKLKILKVELIKSYHPTQSPTKVWAKVYRCGGACL